MGIPTIEPYRMPVPRELPANTASWRIDPRRAMLLVHDMQKYFLSMFPQGTAPVSDLVDNVARLRDRFDALGMPIGYTAQPGSMTVEERGLLQDFWGPGMTADAEHRAIHDRVAPPAGSPVFTKWRYSAFQRTDLLAFMREHGRDQLVICGVYAHVGCLMTANDALAHDIEAFLVADAIADFTPEYHRLALDYAAERLSVVLSTDAVLASAVERKAA
jgi:isochorismate hydrolase